MATRAQHFETNRSEFKEEILVCPLRGKIFSLIFQKGITITKCCAALLPKSKSVTPD